MNSNFDEYISNLKSNREDYPSELFEFAVNTERYELNHPQSLHDSWVSSITIAENRNKVRPFEPSLSIVLNLLGQQHDRDIVLSYSRVQSYEILGSENPYNYGDTFHGDVLTHEISTIDGSFHHIIELRSGSVFKVSFNEFSCLEQVYT